jgi:hypothetical protein
MAGWEDVRLIAAALPGAEESRSYGKPCFRVHGKAFVNIGRIDGTIVTRAGEEEIELLIRAKPDVYFLTPHYEGWSCVLVRLDAVDEDELAGRLEDAWELVAAKASRRKR